MARRLPSSLHEVLVELFRHRGELAPALLAACAQLPLEHDHVALASIDLSQVAPTEYRADAVVTLCARDGSVTGAVIVEIRLQPDDDKRYTWPVYVTALRARLRCPVSLLVVTPERAVAEWASIPVDLDHRGFTFQPIVVPFAAVPKIVDLAAARRLPELAVLSAMAHPELDVALTAIAAIEPLPEDEKRLYLDVILSKLPGLLRRRVEARMIKGYEYQSDFARRYYGQGRSEGLQDAALKLAHAKLGGRSRR